MTTTTRSAWLAIALLVPSAPPRVEARQVTFRAGVSGVVVTVVVERDGRPVDGLTAEDFRLMDNGVEQVVSSATTEAVPLDITVVVDTSGSTRNNLEDFKDQVQAMTRLLGVRDRLRLMTFSDTVREIFPLRFASAIDPAAIDGIHTEYSTSARNGIVAAMIAPDEPGRRRLVVVFTDGQDTFSSVQPDTMLAAADRSDVTLYVGGEARDDAIESVVRRSGGRVHGPRSMVRVFQDVLDEARGSYVLRYTPTGVTAGGWHALEVRIRQPGAYDVRARRGYFGGA